MHHTPGPWHAVNYADFWDIQASEEYGQGDLLDKEKNPQAPANARLMAAAPDLLAAITAILDTEQAMDLPGWLLEQSKEAVRSAEGGAR